MRVTLRWCLATVPAIALLAASAPEKAVAAAGDCRTYNTIKCNRFWPEKYGQYATLEDCIDGETELGNCPPGTTGGGGGSAAAYTRVDRPRPTAI